MWDKSDRELDNQRLERGEGIFALGHRTPGSTVQDAEFDELLKMPSHSIWPPVTAMALAGVFAMLLLGHLFIAAGFAAAIALTLVGWHHHGSEA
jgi:hypothetical protein